MRELIEGLGNPRLDALFPDEMPALRHDVELIRDASHPFDLDAFLAGRQTPVFFGSAINNFGVQEILQALIDWAPPPQPRDGGARVVQPTEPAFSRLRVQDPGEHGPEASRPHRVLPRCSGRYVPAMKVRHLRAGREMKLANVLTFMANERVASEDAVAGDIIGIHNHGQLSIGDTLTEGEALDFKGIPYFAPELFRVARPRDPFKAKQLAKGLQELGEEGAIQVFEIDARRTRCCWAPSASSSSRSSPHRLATRIQGRCDLRSGEHRHRALAHLSRRERRAAISSASRRPSLATDVDDNPVFLATNKYNLQVTMERWPKVGFHATREHGERLAGA